MSSIAFVEVTSVYDAVDVLFDKIDAFDSDVLSNSERAELLDRRQTWRRRLPAGDHELINHLATPPARARVVPPNSSADAAGTGVPTSRLILREALLRKPDLLSNHLVFIMLSLWQLLLCRQKFL